MNIQVSGMNKYQFLKRALISIDPEKTICPS